ncbi:MAG: energy transducer TonB [Chitinophagaceae bacterium]|nr:energy transducer TonB [Oligoflexus sp.]
MQKDSHKITTFTGVPRQSWYWVAAGILLSLLLHIISITELPNNERNPLLPAPKSTAKHEDVKVNIVKKKKDLAHKAPDPQKLLETPLAKTEAPKAPSRLGAQDHIAEKEKKVSSLLPRPKAADPGQLGREIQEKKAGRPEPQVAQEKPLLEQPKPLTMTPKKSAATLAHKQKITSMTAPDGTVIVPSKEKMTPRTAYEKLMPTSKEMTNQVAAGYQDYVEDAVETGDKIDLNTTNFRFIGYFTSIRKAFELVWVYPSEAVRRGLQGETHVEFTINKDGTVTRIKVVESSGHKILDEAVVEALKLASPFGPLPPGYNKDHLTIVGSFRYVLTNFANGP